MKKEKVADDFFTIKSRRIAAKSRSGYPVEAIKLLGRDGKAYPVFHISLGPITEVFYDIRKAVAF